MTFPFMGLETMDELIYVVLFNWAFVGPCIGLWAATMGETAPARFFLFLLGFFLWPLALAALPFVLILGVLYGVIVKGRGLFDGAGGHGMDPM